MPRIRAAVCRAFGAPLTIEEIDLAPPGAGEVEVTLGAVAICHSDISFADGIWGGTLPAVYGHEAAGRITATGPGVTDLSEGDTVVATLIRSCGACPSCAGDRPAYCEAAGSPGPLAAPDGSPIVRAMNIGAFAERVVVDQSQVVRISPTVPVDAASLLACGVITGAGAVLNAAALKPGQDAVVIGAGGVGLNAIQGARIAGARRIVAVDMTKEKLEHARAFGATDGVLGSETAPWEVAKAALGRGADAVFVTVGAIRAFTEAPRYLARGGRAYLVGMPASGAEASYEPVTLASEGQALIGTKMGDAVISRDIPRLIEAYRSGALKLDELIARRWSFDQINEAIADTRAGAAGRNVIVF